MLTAQLLPFISDGSVIVFSSQKPVWPVKYQIHIWFMYTYILSCLLLKNKQTNKQISGSASRLVKKNVSELAMKNHDWCRTNLSSQTPVHSVWSRCSNLNHLPVRFTL